MNKWMTTTVTLALTATIFQTGHINALAATTKYVEVPKGIDLNVRKSASSKSKKIGTLKNNTKIIVISIKGSWAKINFKGSTAYVSTAYLTTTKSKIVAVSSTSKKEVLTTYYVNTGSTIALNVRKSKSTKALKIGTIKNGAKVNVVSYAKDWTKIKYGTGYGYVSSVYLYKKTLTTSQVDEQLKGDFYAIPGLSTNLNVRKKASISAEKLGEIKQNKKLTVVSRSGNWTKIKYGTGYGYVSNEYVSKKITVDFSRKQSKIHTVYDVESQDTIQTYYQKSEKNIAKWGNVNQGFTHTETVSKNTYALYNYETGYGYSINAPLFVGATTGSLKKGYSKITSVNQTVTVKAGKYKNVVVQKFYNTQNKNTKIVYFAPHAGVILAKANGVTIFELIRVK